GPGSREASRERTPTAHAVRIEFPSTVIRSSGRGWVAGPRSTEPSVIRNRLPWHGQSMVPSATVDTRQCWWVQTAENALNSPAVGWVTTIFSSFRTVPPPTGTSPAGTSSRPPGASGPDVLVTVAEPVSPPSPPPPPQAAASAAAPAVTRTVRRVASWVMSALRAMWGGVGRTRREAPGRAYAGSGRRPVHLSTEETEGEANPDEHEHTTPARPSQRAGGGHLSRAP